MLNDSFRLQSPFLSVAEKKHTENNIFWELIASWLCCFTLIHVSSSHNNFQQLSHDHHTRFQRLSSQNFDVFQTFWYVACEENYNVKWNEILKIDEAQFHLLMKHLDVTH